MNTINNYFDKIYCINTLGDDVRWNKTLTEFNKVGIDINTIVKISEKFPEDKNPQHCLIDLWMKIIKDAKDNNYEKIIIFEDDVEFINYANFDKTVSDLEKYANDWQVFHLGGLFAKRRKRKKNNKLVNLRSADYLNEHPDHFKRITNNLLEINGGSVQTTHSICIKNTVYDEILNFTNLDRRLTGKHLKKFNASKEEKGIKYQSDVLCIDVLIHKQFQSSSDYKTYCAYPVITKSKPNYSNILKRGIDYAEIHQPIYKAIANTKPVYDE